MSNITIEKIPALRGEIILPGDKSISHRAIMLSSIAEGRSSISNLLDSLDCEATISAFRKMGISIEFKDKKSVIVEGRGLKGLSRPDSVLYLGNSGTTMRLLSGILAGMSFEAKIIGDESLNKRPMKRVTRPLRLMGADIKGADDANLAPLTIKGGNLKAIEYKSLVASAQVKSAILFAGLYANGRTKVTEPYKSRDHTERMFELFGVPVEKRGLSVAIEGIGVSGLMAQSISIPGDISSAAFFMACGILSEDSDIIIKSCGINPTRDGILRVLLRMGAKIEIVNESGGFEPCADICVKSSSLKATNITRDEIPLLIDEIPVIALCATQADGTTIIEGIGELRVKETDRVSSIVNNLKAMGADVEVESDSIIIKGPVSLKGTKVESFGDHRTAMMMVIAGSVAEGKTLVRDIECIATSFPDFMETLKSLSA